MSLHWPSNSAQQWLPKSDPPTFLHCLVMLLFIQHSLLFPASVFSMNKPKQQNVCIVFSFPQSWRTFSFSFCADNTTSQTSNVLPSCLVQVHVSEQYCAPGQICVVIILYLQLKMDVRNIYIFIVYKMCTYTQPFFMR